MIPMYRRKQVAKMEKEAPQEFQLIPSSGHLLPGQRKNVQVKFMPLEEVGLSNMRIVNFLLLTSSAR